MPVGEVRRHWAAEALRRAGEELRACELFYRADAFRVCETLIQRYDNPLLLGAVAMTHSLPIPKELTALVDSGFWPRDYDQARAQTLQSLVPESSVRQFAPEERSVFLFPPPFYVVRNFLKGPEEKFWSDPRIALHEIDPDLTLLIGDFALGSEAPIALDYRHRIDEPSVIRLRWAQDGNHWIEIAPTFRDFAAYLTSHSEQDD